MWCWDKVSPMPVLARIMAILWLTFLVSIAATGIFFSAIDPLELKYCVALPEVSRLGAYTIGFFLLWLLTASTSLLCVFFISPVTLKT